jgi:endogenous inhibitor of DNA gyrase (YacG/DUF329 family)
MRAIPKCAKCEKEEEGVIRPFCPKRLGAAVACVMIAKTF